MIYISLKKATLKDVEEITELEKIADSKTYSARVKEDEIKNFIKNDVVFLIKRQDKNIGLVSYEIVKRKTAHINGLVVNPKFRGKGYARQAMLLLLKKMRQFPRIELVVHPRNTPAVSLYLSLGFIIESWKNNYFGDGEPRLVLVKK